MYSIRDFLIKIKDFSIKKFLETKTGKAVYVAFVTLTLSAIGSWAVLAHQDSPSTANNKTAAVKSRPATGDALFAKEAAQGGMQKSNLDSWLRKRDRAIL